MKKNINSNNRNSNDPKRNNITRRLKPRGRLYRRRFRLRRLARLRGRGVNRANQNRTSRLVQNTQNISNKNMQKIDKKIEKLTEDLNKLSLQFFPKTTNVFRRLKEPRVDRIVTPMDMGLNSRFTSIFKTGNRIRYMSLYNRFEFANTNASSVTRLLWFPYAVNFASYPDLAITVSDGGTGTTQPNIISPIVKTIMTNGSIVSMEYPNVAACGLIGNYRVVGASAKITNLTAYQTKAGSYIIYKLNENTVYPPFYDSSTLPNPTTAPDYTSVLGALLAINHDQVMLKQSFSASDVALIHEYNVYEGNNIFQTPQEYIGSSYISGTEVVALWDGNPQGNNIKYQIDIAGTSNSLINTYLMETWQIIEIVPDPSLHLDNITDFQTHVFNEEVIDEMRKSMPIVKG